MRLQKKEIYNILKKFGIITYQKCKDFQSTTYKNSHWLNNEKDLKIWANGINYIAIEFYYYNDEYEKKVIRELTIVNNGKEWIKYYEREKSKK